MIAELTLESFLRPEILWTLIGLVLVFLELFIPGLVIIFFGAGACLVALACRIWDLSLNSQLVVFLAASIALLVLLRGWLKGVFAGITSDSRSGESPWTENIGQKAVVVERIEPGRGGKVDFHGSTWAAEADRVIEPGETVEVVGQHNITLQVRPV